MSNFHPGQRIRCRGEEWQVLEAHRRQVAGGQVVWEIIARGTSGLVRGQDYCFISNIEDDLEPIDPTDLILTPDTSKKCEKTRVYLEAHLRRLLPRNGAIYLGQHGACEPFDYQLEPASKALHMLRPRILIGDAVGLGKTIECGILLSELIRRGKAQRILVAVPKAVLNQFQMEMWGRFSIPFHRLDSKGLEKLRQDLPSTMNPFYHFNRVIISIDTLKLKKYQQLLSNCYWDVLVIDEAHNVADRTDGGGGSARHRVAKMLAERSRAVILMSATPHDGTRYGFASLIKLLDRTAIPSDENYGKEHIQPYFIRRTRSTVRGHGGVSLKPRLNKIVKIPMTPKEIDILQAIHDTKFETKALTTRQAGVRELFKTTLIKSFLSSPHALLETVNKKLKRLENKNSRSSVEHEGDIEKLLNLKHEIERSGVLKKFSRLEALKDFIKKHPTSPDDRLVIFTERLETMRAITEALLEAGIVDGIYDPGAENQTGKTLVAQAHGQSSLSDVHLNQIIKAFQSRNSPVQILVATNIASEGLNLHTNCHRLIHFDLPWSLITLEQRNGRVDRLGQTRQPEIYYFASEAQSSTRQSDLSDLRDDFWIIRKIEQRMNQAAEDMDEEAIRRGFTSGESEESYHNDLYEDGRISETNAKVTADDLLAELMGDNSESTKVSTAYRKPLPTLYDKSPADFVTTVAKETGIGLKVLQQTTLNLELNHHLKRETSSWPYEFRPHQDADSISLESDPKKMGQHYTSRIVGGFALEKSFMNEIHPALQMLEAAAFGLFPGRETPVVTVPGLNPESIFFLVQGGLFNNLNEPAIQTWAFIEFEKGATKPTNYVDLFEPEHTQEVVNLVKECLSNASDRPQPDELKIKRTYKLIPQAVEWMKDRILDLRKKRSEHLRPELLKEQKRIETWESERRRYLERIVRGDLSNNSALHGGIAAMKRRAEHELERLSDDRERYIQFVKDSIATNATPDIKILAVFMGE